MEHTLIYTKLWPARVGVVMGGPAQMKQPNELLQHRAKFVWMRDDVGAIAVITHTHTHTQIR